VAVGLLLLALLAADGERPRIFTVAASASGAAPIVGQWPVTGALELGVDPLPQLRMLVLGSYHWTSKECGPLGAAGHVFRVMSGAEAILTAALPFDLRAGALLGVGLMDWNADCEEYGYQAAAMFQVRGSAGYRFSSWLGDDLIVSSNGWPYPGAPTWAEIGGRLTTRW
jgi:hypothetical protein